MSYSIFLFSNLFFILSKLFEYPKYLIIIQTILFSKFSNFGNLKNLLIAQISQLLNSIEFMNLFQLNYDF